MSIKSPLPCYKPANNYNSQYPLVQNDTYIKTTTNAGSAWYGYFATDPSLSLIGGAENNSWATVILSNQRFHIDLGSSKIITRIYYENWHQSGNFSDCGVKNFTFWGSNDASAFAELTYGIDTNWTQLTTAQSTFDQHVALDQADPKYITVTNTTAYRYYAFKFADNWNILQPMLGVRRIELQILI